MVDMFIAGAKQRACLKIVNGSTDIVSGSQLKLSCSTGLQYVEKFSCNAKIRLKDQLPGR